VIKLKNISNFKAQLKIKKIWKKARRGVIDGVNTAGNKTNELTKIGRIKIDILAVKKEIEENLLEFGGRFYHLTKEDRGFLLPDDDDIKRLYAGIQKLEEELTKYNDEIIKIKEAIPEEKLKE
jgi:hypothetical protein